MEQYKQAYVIELLAWKIISRVTVKLKLVL